ncbi:hypothetical protein F2P79_022393 [Pimephales promelas]|nr:hypothetical protein F2P79_022393 [Pimephales promelas]
MEETKHDRQSPSDWGSMQDLTSWGLNDPKKAQKFPLLKPAHVKANLKFANDHLDDPEESWEKVMWSDETKIELFGHNSTNRVYRKNNDEYPRTPSREAVKHGGGSIML